MLISWRWPSCGARPAFPTICWTSWINIWRALSFRIIIMKGWLERLRSLLVRVCTSSLARRGHLCLVLGWRWAVERSYICLKVKASGCRTPFLSISEAAEKPNIDLLSTGSSQKWHFLLNLELACRSYSHIRPPSATRLYSRSNQNPQQLESASS